MADLGRISGPMLKDNLLRGGVDLVFENQLGDNLLYLDVNTMKIGINTDAVTRELTINDSAKTTDLIVDTALTVDTFEINVSPNTITKPLGDIFITPQSGVTYASAISTDNLVFNDNTIQGINSNENIELRPHGTGQVVFRNSTNVEGDLHATGNITLGGTITIGNTNNDVVSFNTDVTSNLVPDVNNFYNLGSSTNKWLDLHTALVNGATLTTGDFSVPGVTSIATRPGNTWYVSVNGDNTNVGNHPLGPFLTIAKAIEVATAGDLIYITAGEYEETFPLTVPVGVSIRGAGIRDVSIFPSASTNDRDAFLMNGETTISDLTVKDFYYNPSANTGYAFRFAPGLIVTTRSPYVQNVTVLTQEGVGTSSGQITVGPDITLFSQTSNSVNLNKSTWSQELVDSLIGQTAVIDVYPNPPLYYTVVSIETDPVMPTQWRMTVDSPFNSAGQIKNISFYPDVGLTQIVTNDIWDTTGNSIGEKWVAWYKTNLPPFFTTVVQPGWTINVATTIYEVDYIIEDPVNTNMWRIYVTTSLVAGVGIPIFSSPIPSSTIPAGRGALVDGSAADITSKQASMLFHSVTLIIPNSIGIYMTNGVRVEWLNSFTYFADKGLYAENGSTGRLAPSTLDEIIDGGYALTSYVDILDGGLASSTFSSTLETGGAVLYALKYGAELRSIGSANVYGTVGAEADGDQTLMYLINHNFAYIGTGTSTDNNPANVIQANEVVQLNSGKIYYQSIDQVGDFRAGSAFIVNQRTGFATFNGIGQNENGINSLVFSNGTDVTSVYPTYIETGNIKFSGNLISSDDGDINVLAVSNQITLTQDVAAFQDFTTTGDFHVDGTITIGNQVVDSVDFTTDFDADLIPKFNDTNNLGEANLKWNTINVTDINLDNILINDNRIQTTDSNSNLELAAAGTGVVKVLAPNLQIDQTLTVNGVTDLDNIVINGTLTQNSNSIITGDTTATGNFDLDGIFNLNNSTFSFENIKFVENRIITTETNSDLELLASGTGIISIPNNNVVIDNDLTVGGIPTVANLTIQNNISVNKLSNDDILIDDNYITTTLSDSNLELVAAGTGKVIFENLTADQNIDVAKTVTLLNTVIDGDVTVTNSLNTPIVHSGVSIITGEFEVNGSFTNSNSKIDFDNIELTNNTFTTTETNSNLELKAAGTGVVSLDTSSVLFNKNLTVNGLLTTKNLTTTVIDVNGVGTEDILIDDNFITTTLSNSNLDLRAHGTGIFSIPTTNVNLNNDLFVSGSTSLTTTNITGLTSQTGNFLRTGSYTGNGQYEMTGTLTASSEARFENIQFVNNNIGTTNSSSDLELVAAGSGSVYFANDGVFTGSLEVTQTINSKNIQSYATTWADSFNNNDIEIKDNYIRTILSNSPLTLRGNLAGGVLVEKLLVNNSTISATQTNANIGIQPSSGNKSVIIPQTSALKLPVGTTAQRTVGVKGDLRFNTTSNKFEGWVSNSKPLAGVYSSNKLTSVTAADTNTLHFVANSVATMDIDTSGIRTNGLLIDDNVLINGDTFTTAANSDVNIVPDGIGTVILDDTVLYQNEFINQNSSLPMELGATNYGYVKFNVTSGLVLPVGDTLSRPLTPEVGDLRWNTDLSAPEIFNGIAYTTLAGNAVTATIEEIQELNEIYAILLG